MIFITTKMNKTRLEIRIEQNVMNRWIKTDVMVVKDVRKNRSYTVRTCIIRIII